MVLAAIGGKDDVLPLLFKGPENFRESTKTSGVDSGIGCRGRKTEWKTFRNELVDRRVGLSEEAPVSARLRQIQDECLWLIVLPGCRMDVV